MVQGCTSAAGKSLVATVLCRHFARLGLAVAPFKGQNMSNHARVGDGGEMAAAQYFQALAAGVRPDVRMSPVLVKPEGERRSQVVLLGEADAQLSRLPWRERAARLRGAVLAALDSLAREHELLVIEGAGSPAEINLADCDLANAAIARHAEAPVLLVADIDRGGAFAHLYGTWSLMEAPDRGRIAGWILNRFRGEKELLAPAPKRLRELTGVPTLGVVPSVSHGLPEEDGAGHELSVRGYPCASPPARRAARVAVVRYPTASNLDEFSFVAQVATIEWTVSPASLESADLVVLPGSKHVSADLEWIRQRGLGEALRRRARAGGRLLAICGGMQIAGRWLRDDGAGERDGRGLGLLPLRSTFGPVKRVGPVRVRFGELPAPWSALSGLTASGYELRHGASEPVGEATVALADDLGFASGSVLGVYPHGLLEDAAIVQALLGVVPGRDHDRAIEELTEAVAPHLDLAAINALVGLP